MNGNDNVSACVYPFLVLVYVIWHMFVIWNCFSLEM